MFRLNIPCFNFSLLKFAICGADMENLCPPAPQQPLMYWKVITTPPFGLLHLRLKESKAFRQTMRQLRIPAAQGALSRGA